MAKIKIQGAAHKPDVSKPEVGKREKVTWETDFTPAYNQYLRVAVRSEYVSDDARGEKGEKTVELTLAATDGSDNDVENPYFLYLVTESEGSLSATETLLVNGNDGPCLVIDEIGKPPGFCDGDEGHEEEEHVPHHAGAHHRKG